MDIAAISMMLSQSKIQQQAGISVMKMAMDTGENQVNELIEMLQETTIALENSVTPYLGGNIDITL
jgi:hypothetical protein